MSQLGGLLAAMWHRSMGFGGRDVTKTLVRFLPKGRVRVNAGAAFTNGLVNGLAAATLIVQSREPSAERARYKGRGIKGDVVAVGNDMRRAMASAD